MALVEILTRSAINGAPTKTFIDSSDVAEVFIDPLTERTVIRTHSGSRYETEEKSFSFVGKVNRIVSGLERES